MYDGAGAPDSRRVRRDLAAQTRTARCRTRGGARSATTTPSPASAASSTTDEGHYEFWTRNPGSVDGEAPVLRRSSSSRAGLPDKLHTRIYLPEDEALLAADPLLLVARRRRARYAHRDAHACGRPPPRHPAAGREGDRVPCFLTCGPTARAAPRRGSPGRRGAAVTGDRPHAAGWPRTTSCCAISSAPNSPSRVRWSPWAPLRRRSSPR